MKVALLLGGVLLLVNACIELDQDSTEEAQINADLSSPTSPHCSHDAPANYDFIIGQSYFGQNNWIEYIPGSLPIIISAPHGGELTPPEVPIYNDGLARDGGSQEYARAVAQSLFNLTGKYPHLIINHLARNRLNLNRAQIDDNHENPLAMVAWNEFHNFISSAKDWVSQACGKGLYFDFHTNGHDHGYNELGYLLSRNELNEADSIINNLANNSSLNHLASEDAHLLSELVHGEMSLGNILNEQYQLLTIPNAINIPFNHDYFTGGYNTRTHGSIDGGVIDGIQIESHFNFVNSGEDTRLDYSLKLSQGIFKFVQHWYGFDLKSL